MGKSTISMAFNSSDLLAAFGIPQVGYTAFLVSQDLLKGHV